MHLVVRDGQCKTSQQPKSVVILFKLQAWRKEGLPLTTTSNEAAKMYDATLTQVRVKNNIVKIVYSNEY